MISARKSIDPANDNYARLAAYIADASHKGEKCLVCWCAGCLGGDDYAEGIAEAVDVQGMNTRSHNTKTYHLVISFCPEDEARLTPETFKAIEERFAAALGYADHQRHCGVHKNTANLHMHVAYNMVHPEKYTVHKEFRDYWIRDKVCRELEREYGLVIDNGRRRDSEDRQRRNEKAAITESHTGQQSFESYAREHRESILAALEAARGWQDVHAALAARGMEIKPHGRGFAVKDRHSNRPAHAIKASALDRGLSQKRLEDRIGPYEPPRSLGHMTEQSRYEAAPLHRAPERGALFTEYKAGIETRKAALQAVKEKEDAAVAKAREKWEAERHRIERLSLDKHKRRNLIKLSRKYEAEAVAKARLALQPEREAVRREVPFTSWSGFLQHKAGQGNETALAILRSRREVAEAEKAGQPGKDWSRHGQDQFRDAKLAIAAKYAGKEAEAMTAEVTRKGEKRLLAMLRMERLAEEERLRNEAPVIDGFKTRIDRKGTVIFTLPGGGILRDTGRDLFFSANDKAARAAAMLYARAKWGKLARLEGNKFYIPRKPAPEKTKERMQRQEPEHTQKKRRERGR